MNALILIDIQNDFLPGGALAVPKGNEIIPLVNALQRDFDLVVATQDWHPKDHGSFAVNQPGKKVGEIIQLNGTEQILWPAHCVQNTMGAELAKALKKEKISKIIFKGTDALIDSYSAFFDNKHLKATGLGEYLKRQGVDRVHLAGLATDYCVKFSALDALQLGFSVVVFRELCRGIDLKPGDVEKALAEMQEAGATIR